MPLRDLSFVDLYLGEEKGKPFCDVKILPGADAPRQAIDPIYEREVEEFRALCLQKYDTSRLPEYPIEHDGVRYRVTVFDLSSGKSPFFTVNRVSAKIFELHQLLLPEEVEDQLMDPALRGLVLICGSMSSGKTSSAHSILSRRLHVNGGLAMAIEDPIENELHGMHGQGRCIQVEVSRHLGGYREQLTKALRARVGTVLVGEIRDADTAERVLSMASTDHLVISTIHASSPTSAIELLYTYASAAGVSNAASLVASGLTVVIWQKITREGSRAFLHTEPVSITDSKTGPTIRTFITERAFHKLPEQFRQQFTSALRG